VKINVSRKRLVRAANGRHGDASLKYANVLVPHQWHQNKC